MGIQWKWRREAWKKHESRLIFHSCVNVGRIEWLNLNFGRILDENDIYLNLQIATVDELLICISWRDGVCLRDPMQHNPFAF